MNFAIFVAVVAFLVAVVAIVKGFRIVRQSECMIVERLGSFSRVLTNGFNITIPFIEAVRPMYWTINGHVIYGGRIDLRETVLDIPEQAVITRDNVTMSIDAILYVQITDPIKATYEIANLPLAVAQLAQTSLRNVIGELDLDDTLASRDIINTKLKTILDEATDKWGVKVNRVELRNITPPRDIQEAMEKQMQAERERRAKILEAEGDKQARVARSEGIKIEEINIAEGQKEARIRRAEAEAEAIRLDATAKRSALEDVKGTLGSAELTAQYLVASNYLNAFEKFTQSPGDKVFVPYEASTAIASIGGIKDLLTNTHSANGDGRRPTVRPAGRQDSV